MWPVKTNSSIRNVLFLILFIFIIILSLYFIFNKNNHPRVAGIQEINTEDLDIQVFDNTINHTDKSNNLNSYYYSQSNRVVYFYSNEIINSYTSEKYFVRRDKGNEQCAIVDSKIPTDKKCILSPYENSEIGVCGQDRRDKDPASCELIVRHADGTSEPIIDLLRVDNGYDNYYSKGIVTGAEIIKFSAPDKLILFFGYDFPDSHRGTITSLDLKTKKLSPPIIDYYGEGNHSFFKITKRSKSLIFLNDIESSNIKIGGIIENGIYLEVNGKIKKINLPGIYIFTNWPFVYLNTRENYQNDNLATISIEDDFEPTNNNVYIFDFDKEVFIK